MGFKYADVSWFKFDQKALHQNANKLGRGDVYSMSEAIFYKKNRFIRFIVDFTTGIRRI